jgi:HD-like signal output (HDOD) protein
MSTRILFVDDEPHVLAGLRRLLRPMRDEWLMRFADSGPQALAEMAAEPFDVVITDMRMPGMDGGQLLTEVAARYPHVVRMVLSGQADHETVMRVVEPTHQYLSKPCDPDLLKSKVTHACALRQRLGNPAVREWVASIKSLPTLPASYVALLAELRSPTCSAARIADFVSRDPAMTARILQLVNSAFFGVRGSISDPVHAVQLLGVDTIGALVLGARIFTKCDGAHVKRLDPIRLWDHSVAVSRSAQALARHLGGDRQLQADAFTAGLLHASGILVLACAHGERYLDVVSRAASERRPLHEIERESLSSDHAEVGAYLLGLWGLPDAVVDAVRWHLRPSDSEHTQVTALTMTHVANVVDHQRRPGLPAGLGLTTDDPYLAALGKRDDLRSWRACLDATPIEASHA